MNPLRGLTLVTEAGPAEISPEDITADLVGWKAFGLTSTPAEWVPPFFVLADSAFDSSSSAESLEAAIGECVHALGLDLDRQVMVRSSGSFETIRYRGQLPSRSCAPAQVLSTVRNLMKEMPNIGGGHVHWIIQKYVKPKQKGQLSNERRLRLEKRDWVIEVEPEGERYGSTLSIAVRQWRDGTEISDLDLKCTSRLEISIRLRRVAMWATRLPSRTLFEWVWDGAHVRIVQADVADPEPGVNPKLLLPTHAQRAELESLSVFRTASEEDYEKYGKLRNAKLYRDLGYDMPNFYILNQRKVIDEILSDRISTKLKRDLEELTKRPLIIRTDGRGILTDQDEMLPRSEELRSYGEARDWLRSFTQQIRERELENENLCLVAHHFIPSLASAWARAEPDNRIVRIESLWGIPEGLYWYSHDTFEIDTQTTNIDAVPSIKEAEYKVNQRLRYKGRFIAPNAQGKWIPYHTKPPFDWNASISKRDWLFQIAQTTRLVAQRENYPVSVMWFIGNHSEATSHQVMPWFHDRSELSGPLRVAPRQKRKSARDFTIEKVMDWENLQQEIKSGTKVERVVVKPIEPELIRNPKFARELARSAALYGFVVELSGGLLSHIYHVLHSEGAQVECVDLFGAEEDIIEYSKVVRDKVPSIIERRGERVEKVRLTGEAFVTALQRKLVEEALEARDARSGHELIGELADIEEVIRALSKVVKFDLNDVEVERKSKRKKRGGFDRGLMLTKTTTPHSIQKPEESDIPTLNLRAERSELVISRVLKLPAKPSYRRPDLRQVDEQLEKLFTFETDMSRIGDKAGEEVKETLTFSIPVADEQLQGFALSVELRRAGASVRGVVRLRLLPSQLELDFSDNQLRLDFPKKDSR
jgi:predicted house-cleaning noncanonical NTP pyrophosphatase (MazG superfamily)